MTKLFQAKFLVLTFIMLIGSAASSNEILIYTEPNYYKLFRINEDSYRLSFKDSKKYYRYDNTEIRLLLDKVCQEYNFSSVNTISRAERSRDNYDYNKGKYLEIYISCKKKVDPVELAKKLKQKEADRLAYKKEQEKKELKKRRAEALQKRKEATKARNLHI